MSLYSKYKCVLCVFNSFLFFIFFSQNEVFPYPEISNEELEEIKQFVAPVEKFFREDGECCERCKAVHVN